MIYYPYLKSADVGFGPTPDMKVGMVSESRSGGIVLTHPDAGRGAAASEAAELQGFFVVSAASQAEAVSIARSSPHYRNGGRIVVSLIDPT